MKSSPEEFEKVIHQALRSLPDRRAPGSLEHRVLAAIAARQNQPWWKQSFAQWPLAARGLFLLLSVSLVALLALGWMNAGIERPDLSNTFARPVAIWDNLLAGLRALAALCMTGLRHIPVIWIYGVLGGVAALYATVLGVGAAAYRTLYASR
jgi:hypothetical protein